MLTIESKQKICHMIILKEIKKLYKELNSIDINMTTKAEYNKQYKDAHKEEIKVQKQDYYERNKDKLKSYSKQYKRDNKDAVKEKSKLKRAQTETTECECGGYYKNSKSKHLKTKKHLQYLNTTN